MNKHMKIVGFLGTMGGTVALVGATVAGTGAYFQDTKADNHIAGTMGSIQVEGHDGTGANNLDMVFQDMLPGETNSKTVSYTNTGHNTQDVWIVFPDAAQVGDGTAHQGINSLGTYGEIHVASNGSEKFGSANLNDNASSCPVGAGSPACNPLPDKIKLAGSLSPGDAGNFTFSFRPGAKFQNAQLAQVLTLDYDLVATQVGVAPNTVPATN